MDIIASVYSRPDSQYVNWINKGALVYIDKNTANRVPNAAIARALKSSAASSNNIIDRDSIVNKNKLVESAKLYELSDEEIKQFQAEREADVKNAVANRFPVSITVLSEFAGEEWADKEIEFRKQYRDCFDIINKAYNRAQKDVEARLAEENSMEAPGVTIDDFLDAIGSMAEEEGLDYNIKEDNAAQPGLINEDRGLALTSATVGSGDMYAWCRFFAMRAGLHVFNEKCLLSMIVFTVFISFSLVSASLWWSDFYIK